MVVSQLNSLCVHHSMRDMRINAQTTLITLSIRDYLVLTEDSEENLKIQRRILSSRRVYDRLRRDLRLGGTMPAIVVAVSEQAHVAHDSNGAPDAAALSALKSSEIYIVDGLQRTNQLRVLAQEVKGQSDEDEVLARPIRIEVWTNISFPSILYRMMLLNAAQTPMTLKHQLEVAHLHLISVIKQHDPQFEVFTDKDKRRRYKPKQFQGADLVEAFTAFMKRTPIIEAKGIVLEELDQEDFMNQFDEYRYKKNLDQFVGFLGALDEAICRVYPETAPGASDSNYSVAKGVNFLGSKPYLLGVCAAAGFATAKLSPDEFASATSDLLKLLSRPDADDPLALQKFHQLLDDITKNAGKIGNAQREFVYYAFRNFLLDDHREDRSFELYWIEAARRV